MFSKVQHELPPILKCTIHICFLSNSWFTFVGTKTHDTLFQTYGYSCCDLSIILLFTFFGFLMWNSKQMKRILNSIERLATQCINAATARWWYVWHTDPIALRSTLEGVIFFYLEIESNFIRTIQQNARDWINAKFSFGWICSLWCHSSKQLCSIHLEYFWNEWSQNLSSFYFRQPNRRTKSLCWFLMTWYGLKRSFVGFCWTIDRKKRVNWNRVGKNRRNYEQWFCNKRRNNSNAVCKHNKRSASLSFCKQTRHDSI